jgi:hypothetical protein
VYFPCDRSASQKLVAIVAQDPYLVQFRVSSDNKPCTEDKSSDDLVKKVRNQHSRTSARYAFDATVSGSIDDHNGLHVLPGSSQVSQDVASSNTLAIISRTSSRGTKYMMMHFGKVHVVVSTLPAEDRK